jgi:hypothetical protein
MKERRAHLSFPYFPFVKDVIQHLRMRKGRSYSKKTSVFVKVYDTLDAADYEFKVMSSIRNRSPSKFNVPKALKVIGNPDVTAVLMERVDGVSLEKFIHEFLLYRDSDAGSIFHNVGQALHELHKMEIDGLLNGDFPNSQAQLREATKRHVLELIHLRVLNPSLGERILRFIRDVNLDDRLLELSSLHGEAYFTHVFLSNDRIVFLDLEQACRGSAYYDITKFLISLYSSLLFSSRSVSKLSFLRRTFLTGYFGNHVPEDSVKATELFMVLREACNYSNWYARPDFWRRFLVMLKLKRLSWLVGFFLGEPS